MTADVGQMMYTGDVPWHGLGTKLDNPATASEAIVAGGLDWEVFLTPTFYQDQGGYVTIQSANDKVPQQAVIRKDTGTLLGVVGSRYKVLQNKDAFSLFDAIVGEKLAVYHTAGYLGNGEKVWLLAKLPGKIVTTKEDISEKYLLLAHGHDGSLRVTIMFTPVRVVCQNTLNLALGSNATRWTSKHTLNVGNNLSKIKESLGILNNQFSIMEALSQKLVARSLKQEEADKYFKSIFLKKLSSSQPGENQEVMQDEIHGKTLAILEEVSELFETGKGTELKGIRGTAWGAFNAVAEYVDHKRGRTPETRHISLLFGAGANIKQDAWDKAVTLIK